MKPKKWCQTCGTEITRGEKACSFCESTNIGPDRIQLLSEATITAFRTKQRMDHALKCNLQLVTLIAQEFCRLSKENYLVLGTVVYHYKQNQWMDLEDKYTAEATDILESCARNLSRYIEEKTNIISRENADRGKMHYRLRDTLGEISRIY